MSQPTTTILFTLDEWVAVQVSLHNQKEKIEGFLRMESLEPVEWDNLNQSLAEIKALIQRFATEFS